MLIWTTERLQLQLLTDCRRIMLLPPREPLRALLRYARGADMAVVPWMAEPLPVLREARAQGIGGPIALVSFEGQRVEGDLAAHNAVAFSVAQDGVDAVRDALRLIVELAMFFPDGERARRGDGQTAPVAERPTVCGSSAVRDVLQECFRDEVPVVARQEQRRGDEAFIARSVCDFKEVGLDALTLHRFRQPAFLRRLEVDDTLRLTFAAEPGTDYGEVRLIRADENEVEVVTTIPDRLYALRDARQLASRAKPVALYVHVPGCPTEPDAVTDMCANGVAFLSERELPLHVDVPVTLVLPDPTVVITCTGTLRHKEGAGRRAKYGAELTLHAIDREKVDAYLGQREHEATLLMSGA